MFVLLGVAGVFALSSKLCVSVHGGQTLERSTFLYGIHIRVQSVELPIDSLFQVRRTREVDGTSWYIVVANDTFVAEVLPVTSNNDYGQVVEKLNNAMIRARKRHKGRE